VSDLFFSPNIIFANLKTVYILFNPCAKVSQRACARLVAH